jgi:hypothetical protein
MEAAVVAAVECCLQLSWWQQKQQMEVRLGMAPMLLTHLAVSTAAAAVVAAAGGAQQQQHVAAHAAKFCRTALH